MVYFWSETLVYFWAEINKLIEKCKFSTSAEMIERMSESGIKVSDRQLKRDIESLRAEFGLDILYSVSQNMEFISKYFCKTEKQFLSS